MRRLLKPFWFLLALLFLVEAWLWDHLVPLIRWVVDAIPWRALKVRLAEAIDHLSPQATLVVFLIPAAIYFGLELIALWPLAYGRWLLALIVLGVAKVIGAAITAFAFDVTRDKLLQMNWFRRGYDTVIGWRDVAHRLADPHLRDIRAWLAELRPAARSRFARFVQRLRRRAQATVSK
ncbi:hypothetical protein [Bradyrhizobium sp. 2TAF24]|uniref:hypothetical protein n=1 Tax=Bradyrhizobium sp. 2TAF24 TaxID=3233011 RepID=UPI003F8F6A0A